MPTTLGAHSPKLDVVRALRTTAGRREHGRFAVDGITMLGEAVDAGHEPHAIYATESGFEALRASGAVDASRLDRTYLVAERSMAKLSDLDSPPGILSVFSTRTRDVAALLDAGDPVLALARLADPGNAGTLVRTAEIFGVERIVFGTGGVDAFHPKVVRATMGAIFRVAIATADGSELARAAGSNDYALVSVASGGESLPDFRFDRRSVLVVGNERHGVDGYVADADRTVSIPQRGAGESLNAAIAGSIVLYAFSQQTDPPGKGRSFENA